MPWHGLLNDTIAVCHLVKRLFLVQPAAVKEAECQCKETRARLNFDRGKSDAIVLSQGKYSLAMRRKCLIEVAFADNGSCLADLQRPANSSRAAGRGELSPKPQAPKP